LAQWVNAGGVLVTITGAATADRYDEPSTALSDATGVRERPRQRLMVPNLDAMKEIGEVSGELGGFTAFGDRSELIGTDYMVGGKFKDGAPAIVRRKVGTGHAIHFAFLPGISYAKSATYSRDKLPSGWSVPLRKWIVWPTDFAKVTTPVQVKEHALVETPLLLSEKGAVVTVLNWNNEPIEKVQITVNVPFRVERVESVKHGRLAFKRVDGGATLTVPAGAADFVLIRP
jgi:hypothetical protein